MTGTRDLKALGLFVLYAAAVFMAAGAIGRWLDEVLAPDAPPPAPPGPAGWEIDDLLAEARQITKDAADGTTAG